MSETVLEPQLPIIDAHHHLWDLTPVLPAFPRPAHAFIEAAARTPYYTFQEYRADACGGHHVIGSVFIEAGSFHRADGPPECRSAGEVEFANGVAAQSASGLYGGFRACAAIVGHADLTLGDGVRPVLEALRAAGNGRTRGVRQQAPWDADPDVLGPPFHAPPGLLVSDAFQAGFRHLAPMGLSFDAWVLEPQLGDVLALARRFPDTAIVLDHCGTPLNIASYRGTLSAHFPRWKASIQQLAACPNVTVKLGGLSMAFCGMPEQGPEAGLGSAQLAPLWRPYIETCIESFGPQRAMFESNYPVDKWGASYTTLWNTFKRITAAASASDKQALYSGTAARVYSLASLVGADSAH